LRDFHHQYRAAARPPDQDAPETDKRRSRQPGNRPDRKRRKRAFFRLLPDAIAAEKPGLFNRSDGVHIVRQASFCKKLGGQLSQFRSY
jgi:hypothetical protein